jgi:HSP20 family protein
MYCFPALWTIFGRISFNGNGLHVPSANIKEEENGYVLDLSAPGYNKADISIAVENDVLTISGNHQEQTEEKKAIRRV